jgi:hypothetical protein
MQNGVILGCGNRSNAGMDTVTLVHGQPLGTRLTRLDHGENKRQVVEGRGMWTNVQLAIDIWEVESEAVKQTAIQFH